MNRPLTEEEKNRARRAGAAMGRGSGVANRKVPLLESYRKRMEAQANQEGEDHPLVPEAEPGA